MKDELERRIMAEFITLRPKAYAYLTDDGKEDKKAKGTKKCVLKRKIKFDDYKKCLLDGEVILKSQQRFRSKGHDVYTENINKIVLSSNDDKRIVSSDKVITKSDKVMLIEIKVSKRWFNNRISKILTKQIIILKRPVEIPRSKIILKGSVGIPRSKMI